MRVNLRTAGALLGLSLAYLMVGYVDRHADEATAQTRAEAPHALTIDVRYGDPLMTQTLNYYDHEDDALAAERAGDWQRAVEHWTKALKATQLPKLQDRARTMASTARLRAAETEAASGKASAGAQCS